MEFQLERAREVLSQTPATLNTLLRPLSETWITPNEGPSTWSPYDVVGHLIHGEETDWIPRAKLILEHGEERNFEPFDRFAPPTEASLFWFRLDAKLQDLSLSTDAEAKIRSSIHERIPRPPIPLPQLLRLKTSG